MDPLFDYFNPLNAHYFLTFFTLLITLLKRNSTIGLRSLFKKPFCVKFSALWLLNVALNGYRPLKKTLLLTFFKPFVYYSAL